MIPMLVRHQSMISRQSLCIHILCRIRLNLSSDGVRVSISSVLQKSFESGNNWSDNKFNKIGNQPRFDILNPRISPVF